MANSVYLQHKESRMKGQPERSRGMQEQPKQIKDIGFSIGELSETESDLIRAIEDLGAERELTIRLARIIRNKFDFCRSVVRAQHMLEQNNFIEVIRE